MEHTEEKEDESTTEWSFHGEIFMLNSQKQNFLQNVELYLPRIIFWFRPVYAVQLGVRFVIQALTGNQDKTQIEAIIVQHTHIYNFFIREIL